MEIGPIWEITSLTFILSWLQSIQRQNFTLGELSNFNVILIVMDKSFDLRNGQLKLHVNHFLSETCCNHFQLFAYPHPLPVCVCLCHLTSEQ